MAIQIIAADDKSRKNAETVIALYEEMINEHRPRHAVQKYVRFDYIQHNSMIPDGNISIAKFFEHVQANNPRSRVVIHKVIAVQNQVWAFVNFLNFTNNQENDRGLAGVDIYRIDDDGKLAEHWDAVQEIGDPTQAANDNGIF
ncbi:MAG: nuclear transport factor 2 family protein [Bacteroidota bacterium]